MKVPGEAIIVVVDEGNNTSIERGELKMLDIDENMVAKCDLCGTDIGTYKNLKSEYSPEQVTKAVINGLRPEKTLSQSVSIVQSANPNAAQDAEKRLYDAWREMAIESETPWAFCPECTKQVERYLNIKKE